ncbi:hypothetical protein JTB14_000142 [Gonioctena quinquepunctata]|nr:hypothetical protein JTB14_000142 [Gonioctena quinquepunctata]
MIVKAFEALLSRHPEHSNCYTDASKSEGKLGAAFVFQEEIKRYPLPPSTSVYSGEIFAMLQAVKYITIPGIQKATLITHSLSAVETLEQIEADLIALPPEIDELTDEELLDEENPGMPVDIA